MRTFPIAQLTMSSPTCSWGTESSMSMAAASLHLRPLRRGEQGTSLDWSLPRAAHFYSSGNGGPGALELSTHVVLGLLVWRPGPRSCLLMNPSDISKPFFPNPFFVPSLCQSEHRAPRSHPGSVTPTQPCVGAAVAHTWARRLSPGPAGTRTGCESWALFC